MRLSFSILIINLFLDAHVREPLVEILKGARKKGLVWTIVDRAAGDSEMALLARTHPISADVTIVIHSRDQLRGVHKFIKTTKANAPGADIILMTDECKSDEILDLLKAGASDYIVPPLSATSALPRISRFIDRTKSQSDPVHQLVRKLSAQEFVGCAPAFLAETSKIPLLANCDGRVLILGETGTGKELFARAIHYLSPRRRFPFIPVSCGAIPFEMVESELFGHTKGAFTGALESTPGLISEAAGGTLFLDDVDCFPLASQTKLLRFLQEGEYRPLGNSRLKYADVRIIAASNQDLRQAVKEGRMRQDLYYRLNIIQIGLPPLRSRVEDIPILARHFLKKHANEFNRSPRQLSSSAMQALILYDWPGNVRELENTIERAVALADREVIEEAHILLPDGSHLTDDKSFNGLKSKAIAQFERSYIEGLMTTCHGNVSKAARAAKKNRRALWELIRKHHIDVSHFRTSATPDDQNMHNSSF